MTQPWSTRLKTLKLPHVTRRVTLAVLIAIALWLPVVNAQADNPFIIVVSTTSTEDSGLFAHILPAFEAATGLDVRVVAVGTGQAIRLAENGDADVLFVHHKPSEEKFVAEGYGVERHDVMYNDFVLLGRASDPAGIAGMRDAVAALAKIAEKRAMFASRGDDSGTHKMELSLWHAASIDPKKSSGGWYRELGSGMGATLNTAVNMGAYVISDRATWIAFQNKGDLKILVEHDPTLLNQYGVILVSPKKHPHVKALAGQKFVDWLISKEGQQAIASYKRDGQQLFFPNAGGNS